MADVKQQVKLLADADAEILLNLRFGQRTAMHCDQFDLSHPRTVAGDLVTDDKSKVIVPDAIDRQTRGLVGQVQDLLAIDIDTAAGERVVVYDDVLQAGLRQFLVIFTGRHYGSAVGR